MDKALETLIAKLDKEHPVAVFENPKDLMGYLKMAESDDILEQAHWVAAPMKDVGTCEQFHEVVKRAKKVIELFKAREAALRQNFDLAKDTIKKLEAELGER